MIPDAPRDDPPRVPTVPKARPIVGWGEAAPTPPDRRQGVGGASLAAGGTLEAAKPAMGRDEFDGLGLAVASWTARPTVPALHQRRAGRRRDVDLAATLRAARRTGGQVWQVRRRAGRRRTPGLVVLWDVSGSMVEQIRYYGMWLAGLVRWRTDVTVYAFGAAWADVTPLLADPADVWGALSRFEEWGGGTAIGQAVAGVVASSVLRPSTRVVVISDGWEAAPAEELARALARLKNRCARLVWLNPLMATRGYEPIQRGIRVALRYVDRMTAGATYRELARIGQAEAAWR